MNVSGATFSSGNGSYRSSERRSVNRSGLHHRGQRIFGFMHPEALAHSNSRIPAWNGVDRIQGALRIESFRVHRVPDTPSVVGQLLFKWVNRSGTAGDWASKAAGYYQFPLFVNTPT